MRGSKIQIKGLASWWKARGTRVQCAGNFDPGFLKEESSDPTGSKDDVP